MLVVSENGYGKRSNVEDYRVTNRGGKGVLTLKITDKTGPMIAIHAVTDDHDIMIINKSGVVIRTHVRDISQMSRNTQGVRLINLEKRGDEIASVCRVLADEEEPEEEDTEVGVFVEDDAQEFDVQGADTSEMDDEQDVDAEEKKN